MGGFTFRAQRTRVQSRKFGDTVFQIVGEGAMNRRFVPALLIAATIAVPAFCATGNLVIYDDADKNSFDHNAAACGGNDGVFFGETQVVHSGSAAIAVSKFYDNNGAGWAAPAAYSASADYDGISFWVNAGSDPTTVTSLGIYDAEFSPHFLHLEDVYGAGLPANTWIQFQIPFSSPFFAANASSPPETVQVICLINHNSGGTPTTFLYFDDIALTGADIFKDGFEN